MPLAWQMKSGIYEAFPLLIAPLDSLDFQGLHGYSIEK
jgi:hypothetical protein